MRIYYGGPIMSQSGRDNKMRDDEIKEIKRIISFLRDKGHEVFSPAEIQNFIHHTGEPEEVTGREFQYLKYCDLVMIKPGDPPSGGAHVQLGWASAFGKPVVILTEGNKRYSNLVRGLNAITKTNYVDITSRDKLEKIEKAIKTG